MKAWLASSTSHSLVWLSLSREKLSRGKAPHHAVPPSTEYQRSIITVMVFLTRNTLVGRISTSNSDSNVKCRDVIVVAFELHTTNELTTTNIEVWPISHAAGSAHTESKKSFFRYLIRTSPGDR